MKIMSVFRHEVKEKEKAKARITQALAIFTPLKLN
jgi:hypothetical protein